MAPGDEPRQGPPWRRAILLCLVAAGLLAAVYFSPLREYLGHLQEVSQQIRAFGLWAPVVLTCGIAVLVAVGFPRLLFCVLAGMALGFWWGLLWAQLGTLLGNLATYWFARRSGHAWAEHYLARRGKLHSLIVKEGVAGMILLRQLPVPGLVINLTCGLLAVRPRHYIIGTIIGQLPEAVPCTLIGAGLLQASSGKIVGWIALAAGFAAASWIGLRWLLLRESPRELPADD
jgi:uncharacterized membrane protein YdjX (TVP38/TMEM64 family)